MVTNLREDRIFCSADATGGGGAAPPIDPRLFVDGGDDPEPNRDRNEDANAENKSGHLCYKTTCL